MLILFLFEMLYCLFLFICIVECDFIFLFGARKSIVTLAELEKIDNFLLLNHFYFG